MKKTEFVPEDFKVDGLFNVYKTPFEAAELANAKLAEIKAARLEEEDLEIRKIILQ